MLISNIARITLTELSAKNYINSADIRVLSFIENVNTTGAKSVPSIEITRVEKPLAEKLHALTGINYSG